MPGQRVGDGGNTLAKKTKEEIAAITAKRFKDCDFKKFASYGFKGKKHTAERNLLMSRAFKGKLARPITRSDLDRLRECSKAKSRRVLDTETGMTYASVREAARQTGLSKTCILRYLKTEKRFKSA